MTDTGEHPAPRDSYRVLAVGFGVVIAIAVVTAVVLNVRRAGGNKDYPRWYAAGQRALHGGDLYTTGRGETFEFMYPPSCAALLAPLTVAGPRQMAVALVLINAGAWVFCALAAVQLVTGRALRQDPLLYVVPVACTLPYAWMTFVIGQPNLVLLACMLGAFACLRRGREWSAGALVAVAAGIKAFPIAAVVYLVYRRHWRAAVATVGVLALLLVALPAPLRGPAKAVRDVRTWADGMLFHYDADGIGQRLSRGYSWKNQSLVAVAHRLLRPVDADMSRKGEMFVNVADLSFRQVNAAILAAAALLGLAYVWAMPARGRRTPRTDANEWALLLLLILILSPYSFLYFNIWLLYPLAVLTHLCLRAPPGSGERRVLVGCGAAALALLAMTLPVRWLYPPQAIGNILCAQLILFGVLAWVLRREGRPALVRRVASAPADAAGPVVPEPAGRIGA